MWSWLKDLGTRISIAAAHEYCNANVSSPDAGKIPKIAKRLMEMKQEGYPIVNSIGYLKVMAKEKKWQCKPWTMINNDPHGNVVLPCYVLNDYVSIKSMFENGIKGAVADFDWKKIDNCQSVACTVMWNLLWYFQKISMRTCIGHFE